MNRARGMTLVELLIAIALLASMMTAVLSWTRLSMVASGEVAGSFLWESAADAVLTVIHDDVVTGDFPASGKTQTNL